MNSVEVAIEEAVEDVVETVEDLTGITLPTYNVDVAVKPTPPSQTLPPPPAKNSLFPPADQKLELPSFTFPKVEIPEPPKKTPPPPTKKQAPPPQPKVQSPPVELPKISLPKVNIPEIPKPSAISSPPPKVDVPKPPVKKEKKKEDPYMFTEAALKEFIAKDKPQVTELDKQQEEERKKREARNAEIRRAAEAATNAFKSADPSVPVKKESAKKKQPSRGAATPQLTVQSIAKQAKPKAQPKKDEEPISVPPVKGRPTISLFGLGGGTKPVSTSSTTTSSAPKAKTPPVKKAAANVSAPRGVPTISKWKLDASDNTISGFISGSGSFKDGEPVTTSAIVGRAESNIVVKTKSGSR